MMMIRFAAVALAAFTLGCSCLDGNEAPVAVAVSDDGRNEIRLWVAPLAYEVYRDGEKMVAKTPIGMKVSGRCLAAGAKVESVTSRKVKGSEASPVYKKSNLDYSRNETYADFGEWGVRLAARNDGVAYRFETEFAGKVRVNCELAPLSIPDPSAKCHVNFTDRYGCEETLNRTMTAAEIYTHGDKRKFVYLPLVYSVGGKTVAVTESDVKDYPIWNFTRSSGGVDVRLDSEFARFPLESRNVANDAGWKRKEVASGGRWVDIKKHADYLVDTDGTRSFPWRTFILADKPSDLCAADIVSALAAGAQGRDFSWVKPGKVAWDWWNGWDCQGQKGCNTKTYERFIDFAAATGVEYVIFDEGWSERLNIWKFHPDVDVPHLIRYAEKKGVGIILWMAWAQIYRDEAKVAEHFAKLGAKGFKVDFMDRGDADVERFLWKFAEECAKNRMLVDYHGAHRPTGMSRAYPNVLNYEGVHGLECTKWFRNNYDFMENDIKVFFCRMTAGPMDYTPGAMDNYPVGRYAGTNFNPGSVGTRCRQIAMMTLYEAPLQMLSDSPTKYEKNLECFKFMAATPVVWDDTVGLGGCPESYAALARRKGDVWYAAAITNAEARDIPLDTSFLGEGEWKVEIFRDAVDSDVIPSNYVHENRTVKAGEKLTIHLAPGGGFAARFTK